MYNYYFSSLVDLPSLMICVKIQPKGILSSEEEYL